MQAKSNFILSISGGWWAARPAVGRRARAAAEGSGLGFRGWGISMTAGPRGRSKGGCWTGGGSEVWAERRLAAAPPTWVVEEAGWVRSTRGG
jgi:hypothetical protein